ncbi:MAG: hypothetical protein CVV64_19850 [Candidatus Wallbacteria bacterium HGW-Wallbacteria-1]|jgi:ABC-type uncharacterized transport system involved in gliding motility auxiliary subunit|uniref:Uncharacterized protein n=1 Tax=Candidatus Wallbacteria bacterium HGW-Wallbacteria-1 TaxID=2013854 RepID=A0A2N1PIU5_9BACT|nr:MAG: hypothetical protein CVV64_19850 [Candidatus Wallbacteria bacterium HGW-Wallbacteria-1]
MSKNTNTTGADNTANKANTSNTANTGSAGSAGSAGKVKGSDASSRHIIIGSAASLILLAVIMIGINVISGMLYVRYDATEDKVFTLSNGTRAILSKIEDNVLLKFYYSKSMGNVPFNYKLYGKKIEEFLNEYSTNSRGRIRLEVLDPKPDTDEEEWATKYGLAQAALPTGDKFYMGLVVMVADREEVVPFFNLDREEFLEYDITRSLVQATEIKRKTIGVLSSLPVVGTPASPYMPQPQGASEDWLFLKELKKGFDVRKIETDATEIPADISLLMVIHPKDFADQTLYAIDQFVLRGGRLVVMVDPSCQVDESTGGNPYMAKLSKSSDMAKLFRNWGVEYAKDKIAADLHIATKVNAGREGVVDYPIWMTLNENCMDDKSVITAKLAKMMFIEAGVLGKSAGSDVEMTPLVHTTDAGNKVGNDKLMSSPRELQNVISTSGSQLALAAIYRGKFKSAYETAPEIAAVENETDDQKKAREARQQTLKSGHRAEAADSISVMVVADVDFLVDQYCVQAMNFFGHQMLQPLNDNLAFISNAVDFLGGSEDLISVRSRGKFTRTFTTVEQIEKAAQTKWLEEEKNLTNRLEEIQKRINDLQAAKKDGERLILTSQQREEIRKSRDEKTQTLKKRREIRKLLRQDIESLGSYVKIVNLVIMPLAVMIVGIVIYLSQNRKRGLK